MKGAPTWPSYKYKKISFLEKRKVKREFSAIVRDLKMSGVLGAGKLASLMAVTREKPAEAKLAIATVAMVQQTKRIKKRTEILKKLVAEPGKLTERKARSMRRLLDVHISLMRRIYDYIDKIPGMSKGIMQLPFIQHVLEIKRMEFNAFRSFSEGPTVRNWLAEAKAEIRSLGYPESLCVPFMDAAVALDEAEYSVRNKALQDLSKNEEKLSEEGRANLALLKNPKVEITTLNERELLLKLLSELDPKVSSQAKEVFDRIDHERKEIERSAREVDVALVRRDIAPEADRKKYNEIVLRRLTHGYDKCVGAIANSEILLKKANIPHFADVAKPEDFKLAQAWVSRAIEEAEKAMEARKLLTSAEFADLKKELEAGEKEE